MLENVLGSSPHSLVEEQGDRASRLVVCPRKEFPAHTQASSLEMQHDILEL